MGIKDIIRQHGKSVAVVFRKLGIKGTVTPANVTVALTIHKDRFINELSAEIDREETTSWNGSALAAAASMSSSIKNGDMYKTMEPVTVVATKKSSKVKNTLNDILGVLASGFATYQNVKQSANANNQANNAGEFYTTNSTAQTKSKKSLFLIIAIVVIIALAVYVFTRKSK